MILLTRLNGPPFALNPDLIERVEQTPDTVVTLIGGNKYVVSESIDDLLDLVREYRGLVVASVHRFEIEPASPPRLRVIPLPAD